MKNLSNLFPLIILFNLLASLKSSTLLLRKAVKPRDCLHILLTELCFISITLPIFLWLLWVSGFFSWLRINSSTSSTFLFVIFTQLMIKSSFCQAFVRKFFKESLYPIMFVQTIVPYNHLLFCAEQHFEYEYSNVISKDALLRC